MKILTICYDFELGGTQRAAQNFSIAYAREGNDVRGFGINGNGLRKIQMEKENIKFFTPYAESKDSIQEIIKWAPDIIHIHQAGSYDPIIESILKNLKIQLPHLRIIETNIFSIFNNQLSSIDLHTHLSKWCFWRWSIQKPLLKQVNVTVIPYMVLPDSFFKILDQEKINQFKKKYAIPQDKFIFGRVGQKSNAKWSDEIIEAYKELCLLHSNIHLVLVGISPEIESLIKNLSSEIYSRITILDYFQNDEELNLVYNCLDVFVLTSQIGESFGMVLAESLLAETPVIALATPEHDNSQIEVVPHEKAGIIVKDLKSLKWAMEKLFQNQSLIKEYGQYGRKHILSSFTPEILTPKMLKLMEILLKYPRNELNEHLQNNHFLTNISKTEILNLYQLSMGNSSFKTKIFLLFPRLYLQLRNLYRFLRTIKSK